VIEGLSTKTRDSVSGGVGGQVNVRVCDAGIEIPAGRLTLGANEPTTAENEAAAAPEPASSIRIGLVPPVSILAHDAPMPRCTGAPPVISRSRFGVIAHHKAKVVNVPCVTVLASSMLLSVSTAIPVSA
jgi:hypothetical protein